MPKVVTRHLNGEKTTKEVSETERNSLISQTARQARDYRPYYRLENGEKVRFDANEKSAYQGTKGVSGSTGYEPDRVGGS